jgi:aspartyl protease family protein
MEYNEIFSQEWSNIIYVIILIVLLIMGFSSKELPLKKFFEYVGLWIIIALVALVSYSYRFEFFEAKDRVLSDLFPSKAINKNHQQLTINVSQDGHYYLNVKIKNFPVRFMIDTGASEVVIDKNLAIKLGYDLKNINYNKVFQTANGEAYGASIYFDEVDVSGIKFYNIQGSITDSRLATPLLGMTFLQKFYKYEFYRDKLILTL